MTACYVFDTFNCNRFFGLCDNMNTLLWYVPQQPHGVIFEEVTEFVKKLFDMLCSDTDIGMERVTESVSTDPNTGVRRISYPEEWSLYVTHKDTYTTTLMSCGLFWEVFPVVISKACNGENYFCDNPRFNMLY